MATMMTWKFSTPALMDLLKKFLPDPQVAIWANDDIYNCGNQIMEPGLAFQCSDWESDIRIDDRIRDLYLVGNGWGNGRESYDLGFYLAARKVALDCFEKRGRKGYIFVYADENIPPTCDVEPVKLVFGDKIESDIPIKTLISEAQEKFNIWVIWPHGGYPESKKRSIKLFGVDNVLVLENPSLICELIGATIGRR